MSTESGPHIVFVDDNTDELGPLSQQIRATGRASSAVLSPAEIETGSLREAHLVVVDYSLDRWLDDVSVTEISLRPLNGVALASVLREHATKEKDFPPTGFALITGKADRIGLLPDERRPHIISRLTNVEWFFEKGVADSGQLVDQIISLANAVRSLPQSVRQHLGTIDALLEYLGGSKSDLWQRYRDAVERCRPPIHHLAERSHGLVVLRWLLHRILPHTAFLLDGFHLAARLGVSPASLNAAMSRNSPLVDLLSPCRYRGPLSDFDGPRWWRDGIEQLLWDTTEGESAEPEAVFRALAALNCAANLEKTTVVRPVATLDHLLNRESEFASRDEVVPLHLDDWPSYAEPAYARKETIENHPEMRMYAVELAND